MAGEMAKWHSSQRTWEQQIRLLLVRNGFFVVLAAAAFFTLLLAPKREVQNIGMLWFVGGFAALLVASIAHGLFVSTCPSSVLLGEAKLPAPGETIRSFPVVLVLKWGGLVLAQDDGVLSFRAGKLCFDGDRTSFAVGRQHIFGILGWSKFNSSRIIYLTEPWSALQLQISLPQSWGLRSRIQRELDRQVVGWDRESATTARGETLPPLAVDPGYAESQKRLAIGCVVGGCAFWLICAARGTQYVGSGALMLVPAYKYGSTYFTLRKLLRQSAMTQAPQT